MGLRKEGVWGSLQSGIGGLEPILRLGYQQGRGSSREVGYPRSPLQSTSKVPWLESSLIAWPLVSLVVILPGMG